MEGKLEGMEGKHAILMANNWDALGHILRDMSRRELELIVQTKWCSPKSRGVQEGPEHMQGHVTAKGDWEAASEGEDKNLGKNGKVKKS